MTEKCIQNWISFEFVCNFDVKCLRKLTAKRHVLAAPRHFVTLWWRFLKRFLTEQKRHFTHTLFLQLSFSIKILFCLQNIINLYRFQHKLDVKFHILTTDALILWEFLSWINEMAKFYNKGDKAASSFLHLFFLGCCYKIYSERKITNFWWYATQLWAECLLVFTGSFI